MSATLQRRVWTLPSEPSAAWTQSMVTDLGIPALVARVLYARGYHTAAEASAFLDPPQPPDPMGLPGMPAALERLCRARAHGEGVLVYGDYDCDGVCAAALAQGALRALGWQARVHLPYRADGYGLREDTLVSLAQRADCRLVLAVDNGSTAHAAIAAAARAGVEVLVADHHRLAADLPPATAVVNPLRAPDSPFVFLAGVGVAWCLARSLGAAVGAEPPSDIELVAIGTIADVVPLRGANRWLVRAGLRAMAGPGVRPGVRALLAACGVAPGSAPTERDISHGVAPRLNAPGRVDGPGAAFDLLSAPGEAEARAALAIVDQCNERRRAIGAEVLATAERALRALPSPPPPPAVVLADPGWHPGLVGPAAAVLAERLGVPVLLAAIDEQGLCRGSGRASPGWDLVDVLGRCASHLLRFGGHTQAAGFEVRLERLEGLRAAFTAECAAPQAAGRAPVLPLDGALEAGAGDVRHDVAAAMERLAPFGAGAPPPTFLLRGALISGAARMGETGRHARLRLRVTGAGAPAGSDRSPAWGRDAPAGEVQAVAFGLGLWTEGFASGGPFDLAVQMTVNRYRGREALQLLVVDAAPSDGDWSRFLTAVHAAVPRRHPDRDGLAAAFRRLATLGRGGGPLPPDTSLTAHLVPACLPDGEAAQAALAILRDLGILTDDGRFLPPPAGTRLDLEDSPRYRAAAAARTAVAELAAAVEATG